MYISAEGRYIAIVEVNWDAANKERFFFSGQSTEAFSPPRPSPTCLVVKRTDTNLKKKKALK